jgi:hypothetical protein
MSADSPPRAAALTSDIVDLTEDMSDFEADQESGAEDNNVDEESKGVGVQTKKRKARKGRRGGKSKKMKALEKANKISGLHEDANASAAGMSFLCLKDGV